MTTTQEEAKLAADALLEDACISTDMITMMWRVASSRAGASRAELDTFIAAVMFGNAGLRIRESFNKLELWECENGPCPDCCVDCDNATGGYCRKHVPFWENDTGPYY